MNEIINYFDDSNIYDHMSFKSSDQFVKGNILNLDFDNLIHRPIRRDLKIDEIVLSTYLKNRLKLVNGSCVYILYFLNGNYYSYKLTIVDFLDSDKPIMYQNKNWLLLSF